MRDFSSVLLPPMKNAEAMLSTQITMARVHVAFSTKLLVLRTPMIWFELAKLEAKPPPLDFWIKTMPIIKIEAITMKITNALNISVIVYFVYISRFQ